MGPVNTPAHAQITSLLITSRTAIKLLVLCLVIATIPLALYVRVDSKSSKPEITAKTAITVQAAERGKPFLNLQDGREMAVAYRGDQKLTNALQEGAAQPRTLSSGDFDHNGTPDLVAGYSFNGAGMVTLQQGNPDAFAPTDDSVFVRMQEGYNPQSLLPVSDVYQVPVSPDFLVTGNFTNDSENDVLVAAKGGGLYLMTGDGKGGLGVPQQISLPGPVTALAAGEFRAADGFTDVAVGVSGPGGNVLLIFDGAAEGLSQALMEYQLAEPASAIEFGGLDDDPFLDVAVAAGKEITIVHGWGRKVEVAPAAQVEHVSLKSNVRGLALGQFVWDRQGRIEVAALTEDGTVQLLRNGKLDTRPFTEAELVQRNRGRLKSVRSTSAVDIESVPGWDLGKVRGWSGHSKVAASSLRAPSSASQKQLMRTNASFRENDDLLLLSEGDSKLEFVRQMAPSDIAAGNSALFENGSAKISLDVSSSPTAVLALPKKLNGVSDVVVLRSGKAEPSIVPLAPNTTITVDRTDDNAAASACTAALNDCSLRGAVTFANNPANTNTTISLAANTYILSINGTNAGGCDGNSVGDLGANQGMTITGAGAATTIIRQTGTGPANDGDRIMCMNEPFTIGLIYNFSGVTFVGGREGTAAGTGTVLGGAGIIGGELNNSLTMTNVVMANNQETVAGSANLGGGGIQITGGNLIITNSTFGGTSVPGAYTDRTSTTTGNLQTGSGGGVTYTPSSPAHTGGTGTLTVTGTTFSRNTAAGIGGGGADLLIFAFASPGGIGSGSASIGTSTFSNNQATGTGGGIVVESLPTTVATTSFTNNSAGNRGGGIYVGGGSLLLNGTTPSITFTGNTATNAGSSISTAAPVNVDGTNTTIGGDIEVSQGGVWTNNAGSTLAPTNVVVAGGVLNMNNSTMNVSGNLTIGPGGTNGGTFNGNTGTVNIQGNFILNAGGVSPATNLSAGTGTFNFNGTGAQSITNGTAITFFNLTDSNVTQPLTINNSLAVNGSLNVNGVNAILAPVAAAVISGTGTLTGTGTVRVTRTAATADFLSQYTITNKTLTNLLVDYVGTAAQVLSSTTYVALRINNANGVNSAAGTATVNGLLTLTAGQLNVGSSVLIINNGTSVGAGSLGSGQTGTVNYNQGSPGQNVLAANYGNLTFSNFDKVLAGTGTIGVANVFTPGTAVAHTIAGSTINFNGVSIAQTIPAFNYFNLSTANAHAANNITLANGGTIGIAGAFSPLATFSGGAGYVITNNTVDYNGSGSQTIAAFNYNNLTSSNSGARTLQNGGTIGIAGVFTPGSNLYTVTNSTVNFNGAGAQNIPVFNYFNLTSSNAGARTLPNGGTVGVAGTFTPGGNAYTITGSTIDFNGTGAQTIAAFNYNNLTISQARGANSITLVNGGTIGIAGVFSPTATFGGGGYVITGNTINFNGSGPQTIPAFNYNNLTSSSTGTRTLANTGNIGIAGVFTPGTNVYTITGSTVVYNGTAAQTMPNSFLTYNNLTLSNPAGVTGFAGTINVAGNWTNTSVIGFSANGSTVNFNGSGAQVIGGTQPTTFNNLTIANAGGGVSLGQNINVNGLLTLTNDLNTTAFTLTMPNTGTSAGAADVIGNVRRTGFTGGGAALSFGNPFNSIGFIAQGTVPADITVNLVKAAPSGGIAFPTAVLRTYTITPTGGSGFSSTLRLHYLDAELNGNVEADLGLFRFGTAWARQGKTASDPVTNNWVELSGVTQFSPWTLGSGKNDTTTAITSDLPDPSNVNQVVAVNYSVTSNVGGAPTVTGNVTITVNDASGDTCTASVAAGTCNLTLTTLGSKTLTATYSGDANFNGSSDTEAHEVVPANVVVKDAKAAEPPSGTTTMLFTVTLSAPATGAASVNYATADNGSAVGGTCAGGADYETTSGFLNFNTGQQIQTIPVVICSDGSVEPDETFLMNLSTPVNLTITDGQATGTITAANSPGTALISEVRTSGPAGTADEFVEIYNNTDSPLTVAASDASAGYGLFKMGATCGDTPVLLGTIPNGTVIPARGHYLLVGSAYSLANYGGTGATGGNLTMTSDIENDRNVALFNTSDILNISSTTRLDAAGFGTNTGNVCDLLREGTNLGAASGSTSQYSFARKLTTGLPLDTNDNSVDFAVISTTPLTPVGTNAAPFLGGPGPENLASPLQRSATIKASLLDPTVASTVSPNRFRDNTPGPPATSTLGTLVFRRKFTNNTGGQVTRLRFRIVDVTAVPVPPGTADLRAITSGPSSVTGPSIGTVTVQGTTLEEPPAQASGGGLNSTLSAGTITLASPLGPGAPINLQFLLGVQQGGSFRFFIIVEALP